MRGYIAKRLEVALWLALLLGRTPARAPRPGDVVILLGGRTGRDGIGGATGPPKSHKKSLTTMAPRSKGQRPEERKIQRLFLNGEEVTRLIKRCNDFGAGVSVAIGELAGRPGDPAGRGAQEV